MKGTTAALGALGAAALLAGCGITGNLRGHPGYAAFERPGPHNSDRELALSLGPLPIRMGALLARPALADEPEMRALVKDVQAVRVYVYEVTRNAPIVHDRLAETQDKLVARGWAPVVAIRDDGGWVSALVRLDHRHSGHEQDLMRGLVVMLQDAEEVVLVNVIGRFEPGTFSALMKFLDIDTPDVEIGTL